MSKKDAQRDSLRYLETPTAAFPIGSLGLDGNAGVDGDEDKTALRTLVDDLDRAEPVNRRQASTDDDDTEVMQVRPRLSDILDRAERREPGQVHPVLLALSLLGGGVLALGVVAIFGMWLLYA